MGTYKLNWTIIKLSLWVATHKDGALLTAQTKTKLLGEIDKFEKNLEINLKAHAVNSVK